MQAYPRQAERLYNEWIQRKELNLMEQYGSWDEKTSQTVKQPV